MLFHRRVLQNTINQTVSVYHFNPSLGMVITGMGHHHTLQANGDLDSIIQDTMRLHNVAISIAADTLTSRISLFILGLSSMFS